jgi:hypothetical protein
MKKKSLSYRYCSFQCFRNEYCFPGKPVRRIGAFATIWKNGTVGQLWWIVGIVFGVFNHIVFGSDLFLHNSTDLQFESEFNCLMKIK